MIPYHAKFHTTVMFAFSQKKKCLIYETYTENTEYVSEKTNVSIHIKILLFLKFSLVLNFLRQQNHEKSHITEKMNEHITQE